MHLHPLALAQAARQVRLGLGFALVRRRDVEQLPAGVVNGLAAGEVLILVGLVHDARDHARGRIAVFRVPRLQEAAIDQVEHLRFGRPIAHAAGRAGRNDGVVIGNLGVVHESPGQRFGARAGREHGRVIASRHARRDLGRLAGNVAGEEAAVGARVCDCLVLLVQRLRYPESALGAEAVQAVGVALELGEVIQARRRLAMPGPLDRDDVGASGPGPRDDFRRFLAVCRQPLLPLALLEPEEDAAVAPSLACIEVGVDL